jgi:hypothetical protein
MGLRTREEQEKRRKRREEQQQSVEIHGDVTPVHYSGHALFWINRDA